MVSPSAMLHLMRMRGVSRESPERIRSIQGGLLKRALSLAGDCEGYRASIQNDTDPFDCLASMPILSKEDIRRFPGRYTRKGSKPTLFAKTTGSTGTPLEIPMDRHDLSVRTALWFFCELESGSSIDKVLARVSTENSPLEGPFSVFGLYPRKKISIMLDEKEVLTILARMRPEIVRSYPSLLSVIARLNNESDERLTLKSVISGAETLTDGARRLIESSFSCSLFNCYSSMEFCSMAIECPERHSLHVNPCSCIVEVLRKNGEVTDEGSGEAIVTSLHGSAMPFIRYRLGDDITLGKCGCGRGSQVIGSLDGRSNDYFIELPSGRLRNCAAFRMMNDVPGMLSYQVIQEAPDRLLFRYVPCGEKFDKGAVLAVLSKACLGEDVRIEFDAVTAIERGRTGKRSTVLSRVRGRSS